MPQVNVTDIVFVATIVAVFGGYLLFLGVGVVLICVSCDLWTKGGVSAFGGIGHIIDKFLCVVGIFIGMGVCTVCAGIAIGAIQNWSKIIQFIQHHGVVIR